jgi:hypothetical protein
MPGTILSLNEGNKWQKHYLAGTFGQGGSSTFAFSQLTFIASRFYRSSKIGFTVVWYEDLPANEFKSGNYVYLVEHGMPLCVDVKVGDSISSQGTLIRHFGYDLTNYPSPFGERSLYGAMNRILFDPVAPVWFENKVDGWNRGIYGSRNRLNSGSEDAEGGRSLELAHSMPTFSVDLGEYGSIGIEYWVLLAPEKSSTIPVAAYVDHRKPIILSINGQNQSELSALLIRRDAELPYLKTRLICHVDCDRLSTLAKRALFASTREQAKEGYILGRIKEEVIDALKSDDDLIRLNREAKDKSLTEKDDEAKKRIQKEVARMLNFAGRSQIEASSASQKGAGTGSGGSGGGRRKVAPLETHEPPTYVRLVQDAGEAIRFYGGQRRWVRVETDATADYHNPMKLRDSRINIIVGEHLKVVGTTGLRGGRMRVALECNTDAATGAIGTVRIELYRRGLSTLSDEAGYAIVERPKPREKKRTTTFPDFQIIKVDGPDDERWNYISEDDINVSRHASRGTLDEGTLYIYYSSQFPKFDEEFRRWASQDIHRAESFQRRYEVWLAVHSLLMHEQEESLITDDTPEDVAENFLRQERCRLAIVAAMVATQEIKSGETSVTNEDC